MGKHLSIRISDELYEKYVNETIKRSNQTNKLIKLSEVIREVLENGVVGGE